jgi:hypothetical protein
MRSFSFALPHTGRIDAWHIPSDRNSIAAVVLSFLLYWRFTLTLGKNFALATEYVRNLRRGSQPVLVRASDGLLYVIKFTNNPQGPNLAFNESMGSELYRVCRLPGPLWKPILITNSFLDKNPDCWMQTPEGRLRPEPGLCFASRFLGGDGLRVLEILPGTGFKRVFDREAFWLAWLIDICARHADNRQAIFLQDNRDWLHPFFIDHGHMFGGPKGEQQKSFVASRYLDSRIYGGISSLLCLEFQKVTASVNADQLWQKLKELPDEWKAASAIDGFGQCLNRLAAPDLLRNILATIIDAGQRANEYETSASQRRERPAPVLCSRVQGTKLGWGVVGGGSGCTACA